MWWFLIEDAVELLHQSLLLGPALLLLFLQPPPQRLLQELEPDPLLRLLLSELPIDLLGLELDPGHFLLVLEPGEFALLLELQQLPSLLLPSNPLPVCLLLPPPLALQGLAVEEVLDLPEVLVEGEQFDLGEVMVLAGVDGQDYVVLGVVELDLQPVLGPVHLHLYGLGLPQLKAVLAVGVLPRVHPQLRQLQVLLHLLLHLPLPLPALEGGDEVDECDCELQDRMGVEVGTGVLEEEGSLLGVE